MNLKLKNNRKRRKNNTAGITLIALVVTIVVLLILAGISLNLVLGSNGIIAKAKDAKRQTEQDKINTETALNNLYDEMVAAEGGSSSSGGNGDIPEGRKTYPIDGIGKFETTGTIDGGAASVSNPTIPAQYTPVNTKDAKWDAAGGPEYNKGLVIVDDSGNEWVWVPVSETEVSGMYETVEEPIALSGNTGVTTSKYSKAIISGVTRGLPGNIGYELNGNYREPDLATSYDKDSRAQTAGFTNLVDMATNFVSDYETMISSIEQYKGFYIGRYELTANGEKAGETLTDTNWYQSYANCKSLAASDQAITRMIWGCQWDVTCNWLVNNGYSITDSSNWGNYKNYNTANNYSEEDTGYVSVAGSEQDTGYSEYWKANNIYDFAGNCDEWAQEAYFNDQRALRGGSCDASGSSHPASDRYSIYPTYINHSNDSSGIGSRSTLIVQPS